MWALMAWPRAIALGAVVSASSLGGHAYAGGHSHGAAATIVVILLSVLMARLLLADPAAPLRTAGFLITAQFAAHLAATPLGHAAAHSHPVVAETLHNHGGGLRRSVAPQAPVIAEWVGAGVSGFVAQPQMLAAHLLAALLAAAWLARGERWAATTVALLWANVIPARRPTSPLIPHSPVAVPVAPRSSGALSRYRVRALARRGPPLGLRTSLAV